ncbi:putative lysyl-trna synthetase protein [Phaeoacremonium minimum UCRPA7]|uniref:Lysyl-tRNA synthetase n=1 Tax=Phaeoacremonium minimum (strain UCR-PA7) TaxID=1286976 RepID=R8BGW9_PHAM7|nr:putative lysyl-trna synthetase protein [Phaeoacremonium minimum UCRPA7]EON98529.1 putative lysyl-trna synthetase protein [Phaeoacremonium minimum UCRPA7]
MSSPLWLQFLRPYARRPLAARKSVYLSFYELTRQGHAQAPGVQRKRFASTQKPATSDDLEVENEGALVDARIKELSAAEALSYPRYKSTGNHLRVPIFNERYKDVTPQTPASDEVVLHGRVHAVRRGSSKLVFIDITGEFEHVQGLCNFGKLGPLGINLEDFKASTRLLKRGDHVALTGRPTRTERGELTLEATQLPQLLSPSLVPLPTKLVDEDTKIQKRHVDLLVNRQQADILRLRAYIMKYMRDFFHDRGFLEFQTPIMAENAGGAIARPFATTSTEFPDKELALRIAPELWLKRLVVGGIERVFEIGPSFRNEGIDLSHNPEFTTCEYYNAYASLSDLTSQTEDLVSGMAHYCQGLIDTKLTSLPPIDLAPYNEPYKQLEFIPSLESALGFTLPDLSSDTAFSELTSLLKEHKIDQGTDDVSASSTTLSQLLDRLAGIYLEPHSARAPLLITHHPACMSPLSKSFTCDKTGQLVSARAELFVGGRELANMYEEENDPFAQRRKFVEQARYREQRAAAAAAAAGGGNEAENSSSSRFDSEDASLAIDESYISALESGLPPTGGWGCGIERLVMAFSGTRRINDCLSFGTLRNVVGLSSRRKK